MNFWKLVISTFIFYNYTSCLSMHLRAQAHSDSAFHVDPPHWFVKMADPTLEILIHFDALDVKSFQITQQGHDVKMLKAVTAINTHYTYLTLSIAENAKPQSFEITAAAPSKKFAYTYVLKSPKESPRGLNAQDVIYLITPDRFANGNLHNDSFDDLAQVGVDRNEPYARHGGDIQGIIDHLDYIQNLGMTAIWSNPLLENNQPLESYHGYAFTDHYNIDPRFGSNALFGTLVDSLHARSMKIVMDVIYNHIGDHHYLYRDMPDSSWFHFWKEGYQKTNYRAATLMDPHVADADRNIFSNGWFDAHMPDLNQQNTHVERYLIQQTLWWIAEYGIDALRIDTYAYPDQPFMHRWATAVKKTFPDLFLFAETWVHGTAVQAWFLEDVTEPNHLDGLTDFQIYYAINEALNKDMGWIEGVSKLYYTLAADRMYSNPEKLVTFLDNHDLGRFFGTVGEDLKKFEMGIKLLFTLRGIPSIYYGTEVQMSATDGHGNIRQDFPGGWPTDSLNKFQSEERSMSENSTYDLIANLTAFRKNHPALSSGSLIQYVPEDGLFVYFRESEEDLIMVATNTAKEKKSLALKRFEAQLKGNSNLISMDGSTRPIENSLLLDAMETRIFEIRE